MGQFPRSVGDEITQGADRRAEQQYNRYDERANVVAVDRRDREKRQDEPKHVAHEKSTTDMEKGMAGERKTTGGTGHDWRARRRKLGVQAVSESLRLSRRRDATKVRTAPMLRPR